MIGELDALVAAHPLREHLHAQRMLALYRARRQSESLEAYREARSTLVEEIGVEPGAELRGLHEQVLSQDPALDLAPPARAATSAPRPPPPRRRRGLLLGAGALLLAGILAFGVIRMLEPDGLPGIAEDAVGAIDRDSGRITAQYAVGHGPQAVATGAGSLWVANRLDGTVSRIDRGRDEVVTIDVGGEPTGVAFGAGSLWVADGQGRTVAQIAPEANKVVRRIGVGNAAVAVAAGYGAVWVASAVDASVVRIDARSGTPGPPIAVQARPSALAAGAGSIWVVSDTTASVVRLDPRSGAPLAQHPRGRRAERGRGRCGRRLGGEPRRRDHLPDRPPQRGRREPCASAASRVRWRPTATACGSADGGHREGDPARPPRPSRDHAGRGREQSRGAGDPRRHGMGGHARACRGAPRGHVAGHV